MTQRSLDGILVLDLGQIYSGPYCTFLLQQLGARVVKIEPGRGEPIRWRGDSTRPSEAFALINGGKEGLALDLKSEEGHDVFLQLVKHADVVVENFAPGVLARLGLDYDVLADVNAEIILASGKGFAGDSVHSGLRAMDITVQAMSGIVATTGNADEAPFKAGAAVVDFMSGTHLAVGVLAAIVQRSTTGRGQHVQVSMADAVLPSLTSNIAGYFDTAGTAPERVGNRHGGLAVAPYNIYTTRDGSIAILCLRDGHWRTLCRLMERSDLTQDSELLASSGRVRRMEEIDKIIEDWTRTRTTGDLFTALQKNDVPSAPVRSLAEVLNDQELRRRGMLVPVDDHGQVSHVFGSPVFLKDSERVPPSAPPLVGEHSDAILRDLLRLPLETIEQLYREGALPAPRQ